MEKNDAVKSEAQKIADELWKKLSALNFQDNEDGKAMFTLHTDDARKAFYGDLDEKRDQMSEKEFEDEEERIDAAYHQEFAEEYLKVNSTQKLEEKQSYIIRKLRGMATGNITSGDGDLGRDLFEFISHFQAGIDEEYLNYKPELAAAYQRHFESMRELLLDGAGAGLFTSGHSIKPARELGDWSDLVLPRRQHERSFL